jgi:cell division protein FtsW
MKRFLKIFEKDKDLMTLLFFLLISGFIMSLAASPAIAERINLDVHHFVEKQIIYLALTLITIITLASLKETILKKVIIYAFIITVIFLLLVLVWGDTTKGAKRWLNLYGFSLQPSEFLKPFYTGFIALVLAQNDLKKLETFLILIACHLFIIFLLMLQPDFGMTILISTVFGLQLFVAGAKIIWLVTLAVIFLAGLLLVYYLFPHVASRIEKFLTSQEGVAGYQVQKSLESYVAGGLWGKGPGEGTIKYQLPDCHTDFIFPVAAEEFGLIFCLLIILSILMIIFLSFKRILEMKHSLYRFYMSLGILSYFALQSFFNIAVTLNLVPTKGMTLPFISYGGSSLLAQACGFGIFFNILRSSHKLVLRKKTIHASL